MLKEVRELIIKNSQGLHARPAAMFVQVVSKYNASVIIQKGENRVNGKSIMGILTLGAQQNTKLIIEAIGEDATKVLDELVELLSKESME